MVVNHDHRTANQLQVNASKFTLVVFAILVFTSSVTRLGDLLDFGQLFKAYGNN